MPGQNHRKLLIKQNKVALNLKHQNSNLDCNPQFNNKMCLVHNHYWLLNILEKLYVVNWERKEWEETWEGGWLILFRIYICVCMYSLHLVLAPINHMFQLILPIHDYLHHLLIWHRHLKQWKQKVIIYTYHGSSGA